MYLWKSLWVTLIAVGFVLVFKAQLSGAKFNDFRTSSSIPEWPALNEQVTQMYGLELAQKLTSRLCERVVRFVWPIFSISAPHRMSFPLSELTGLRDALK